VKSDRRAISESVFETELKAPLGGFGGEIKGKTIPGDLVKNLHRVSRRSTEGHRENP
jgi:hypothetical protein